MADIEKGHQIGKTKLKLYKAVLSNDWQKAENIYKEKRIGYGETITERGETALHVAALAGHTDFVQNLVERMDKGDIILAMKLRETNQEMVLTNTAFHCAAISGDVQAAKAIATKHELRSLARTRGNDDCLPIDMAGLQGHKEMVRYLYADTISLLEDPNPNEDLKREFRDLLITLINAEIYDVALGLAKVLLRPDIISENMEEEALRELAQKPLSSVGFLDRCIYPLLHRQLVEQNVAKKSAIELVHLLWKSLMRSNETRVQKFIKCRDENVIVEAAKHGNFEFLSILIASYPHVLFSRDLNDYTIFHHAILNRHVDIFKLINIGSVKTVVNMFRDEGGKNMLHLAGKLAPENRLNIVPGAALQLQLELLWFEEVKKVIEPKEVNEKINLLGILKKSFEDIGNVIRESKNEATKTHPMFEKLKKVMYASKELPEDLDKAKLMFEELKRVMEQHKVKKDSEWTESYTELLQLFKERETLIGEHEVIEEYTPRDIFVKEHKELMTQGETWMRDTANSCMIVSALITTIAFAGAITVPGGNADDGYPLFVSEVIFKIFAIADSVSLISSATSLLGFLSILTARYTIDDFRWTLPNKLVIGLVTLFVSIVAMMVAFVMAIFIIFKDSPQLFAIVICAVSSVPIVLFVWQHFRLLVDVAYSTYTSFLLFKSIRDPYLLLKDKKKKRKHQLGRAIEKSK